RSFGLFAVLGLALLAFGALAFFFTRDEAPMAASEPRSAPPVRSASVEPPPLQNVEVHVRTAVDDAQLFVDGEDLGPITPDEDVILEVVPGRYEIELRVGADVVMTKSVEVRAGEPADVFLSAPERQAPARRAAPAPTP